MKIMSKVRLIKWLLTHVSVYQAVESRKSNILTFFSLRTLETAQTVRP